MDACEDVWTSTNNDTVVVTVTQLALSGYVTEYIDVLRTSEQTERNDTPDSLTVSVAVSPLKGAVIWYKNRTSLSIPSTPPDSVPEWIFADSNLVTNSPNIGGLVARNVVAVVFSPTASSTQRAAAIASVNGELVGGRAYGTGRGVYYLRVPYVSPTDSLDAYITRLDSMPGVAFSSPAAVIEEPTDFLRPIDGVSSNTWTTNPAHAGARWNWALERIAAPQAWGCSTGGSESVPGASGPLMAVIDVGFRPSPDVQTQYVSENQLNARPHGMWVTSVLAARGGNGTGITGMMWDVRPRLYARSLTQPDSLITRMWANPEADAQRVYRAGRDGARIINFSGNARPRPSLSSVSKRRWAFWAARHLAEAVRSLDAQGRIPLFVFSAGNMGSPVTFPTYTHQAFENGYPIIRDTFPDRVLVVGASSRHDSTVVLPDSLTHDSNRGPLLDIAAPGIDVQALDPSGASGVPMLLPGTSLATPLVAGTAGLMLDLDPSLSTADLREMLLEGSRRGGQVVRDIRSTDTWPLLNAFEALKLVASRGTAGLCDNRLWIADGGLHAERVGRGGARYDVTLIAPGTLPFASELNPLHGGKVVGVRHYGTNPVQYVFWQPGGFWNFDFTNAVATPNSGMLRSAWGESHDRDSSTTASQVRAGSNATITMTLTAPNGTFTLGSVGVSGLGLGTPNTCIQRDTVGTCTALLPDEGRMNYSQAYAPTHAILSVVRTRRRISTAGHTWQPCRGGTCISYDRVDEPIETSVYTFPFANPGTSTAWPSYPGARIDWLTVKEDGSEWISGQSTRVTTTTFSYYRDSIPDPYLPNVFTIRTGWREGPPQVTGSCDLWFRPTGWTAVAPPQRRIGVQEIETCSRSLTAGVSSVVQGP